MRAAFSWLNVIFCWLYCQQCQKSDSDLRDQSMFNDMFNGTLVTAEWNRTPCIETAPILRLTRASQILQSQKEGLNNAHSQQQSEHSMNTAGNDITQVPKVREQAEPSSIPPSSRAVTWHQGRSPPPGQFWALRAGKGLLHSQLDISFQGEPSSHPQQPLQGTDWGLKEDPGHLLFKTWNESQILRQNSPTSFITGQVLESYLAHSYVHFVETARQ